MAYPLVNTHRCRRTSERPVPRHVLDPAPWIEPFLTCVRMTEPATGKAPLKLTAKPPRPNAGPVRLMERILPRGTLAAARVSLVDLIAAWQGDTSTLQMASLPRSLSTLDSHLEVNLRNGEATELRVSWSAQSILNLIKVLPEVLKFAFSRQVPADDDDQKTDERAPLARVSKPLQRP